MNDFFYSQKQFRPLLGGKLAEKHTHHFVVYKCTAPPGVNTAAIFGPFSDKTGDECYTPESMKRRPTQLCSATLYVWGVGGKVGSRNFKTDKGNVINKN